MRKLKQVPLCDRAEDPEFAKLNDLAIDVDYYVNKQILPPLLRLLEPLGIVESDLVPASQVNTLMNYVEKEPRKFESDEEKREALLMEADLVMMALSSHPEDEFELQETQLDTLNAINIAYLEFWEGIKVI
jgi:hypothetical protein